MAVGALREEGDDDGASWPVESGVQYKRIMLKVSGERRPCAEPRCAAGAQQSRSALAPSRRAGEALQGKMGFGVDPQVLRKVAMEIAQAHLAGVEVAVVVGGGNFFRGAAAAGDFLDRATGGGRAGVLWVRHVRCAPGAPRRHGRSSLRRRGLRGHAGDVHERHHAPECAGAGVRGPVPGHDGD